MKEVSNKLKKKGFNIGIECYIFFNGKIVKAKIIDGDLQKADGFLYSIDIILSYIEMKVLPIDIPKINNWDPLVWVNTNKLYKTYEEAEKHRKKIISVSEFMEGDENVHKDNIIARIKVKTIKQYKKLKDYIDETYIINDNEKHIYESIIVFPCVIIVIENNSGIIEIKKDPQWIRTKKLKKIIN